MKHGKLLTLLFTFITSIFTITSFAYVIDVNPKINSIYFSTNKNLSVELIGRIQGLTREKLDKNDIFDNDIHSPKSVLFHPYKSKFYINSLEGTNTKVYWFNPNTAKILDSKKINHHFNQKNKNLFFQQESLFDYNYNHPPKSGQKNKFKGKPVEMTFSHNGKYLWVTYYRRDYDPYALNPSALAIIDTETDNIVRVMPTGPLPKMITSSSDNKFMAISHWGDNTIGLINIQSDDPAMFYYNRHLMRTIPLKIKNNGQSRDKNCGRCLRGTLFLEEDNILLVGEMRGGQLIGFDYTNGHYLGSLSGVPSTVRHIIKSNDGQTIYFSSNYSGQVSMVSKNKIVSLFKNLNGGHTNLQVERKQVIGKGARTIALDPNNEIVWATANQDSKLVGLDAESLMPIIEVNTNSYPVGLAISPNGYFMISTSQAKSGTGGNAINIFKINKMKNLVFD